MFEPVIIEIQASKSLPGEVGLFATASLPSGTVIATADQYEADFYKWDDLNGLTDATMRKIHSFCLGTEVGAYVPPNLNDLSIVWYMNHSCEPNVGFDDESNFVTLGAVTPGEELCWDYGLGETNPDFKLICRCKSHACRGVITGNDWINPDFLSKNAGHLLPELRIASSLVADEEQP